MRIRALALALALAVPPAAPAQTPPVADAEVRKGIAQVDDGEYDGAILTLDAAARRLAADKGAPSRDLAEAYFYLGVAYLGKGHETSAKARFREAVKQARDMSPSPEKFPPRVIELFEKAREESAAAAAPASPAAAPAAGATAGAPAASSPTAPAKGGGGSKALLIVGGAVLVGGGAALAMGGGGEEGGGGTGGGTTNDGAPAQVHTESAWVQDGTPSLISFVASRPGTVEVTITWQNRNVDLPIGCQLQNPPYTDCRGTYTRTTDTSGRFTAPVVQAAYLLSVNHFTGRGEPENFTITVRYP